MMFFEARVRKEGAGYRITFPGLENVLTYAESKGEVFRSATEALVGCLLEDLDRGLDLPAPLHRKTRPGTLLVPIPSPVAVALMLRRLRRRRNWTTAMVARKLGVSRQAYEKLEKGGGNPSLSTLDRAFGAFGVRFEFVPKKAA